MGLSSIKRSLRPAVRSIAQNKNTIGSKMTIEQHAVHDRKYCVNGRELVMTKGNWGAR